MEETFRAYSHHRRRRHLRDRLRTPAGRGRLRRRRADGI
ncbi:MAG TPA: 50S ribosomal protein L34 [Microbacterium sp.]|nr:50S ribosomal protein L34 [Microbacterium sp.]